MPRPLSEFSTNDLNRRLVGALNRRDRSKQGSREDAEAMREVSILRDEIRRRAQAKGVAR